MGLADRDYMRERDRAYRPPGPPELTLFSALKYILVFVAITYWCVKGFYWWTDSRRLPQLAVPPPTAVTQPTPEDQAKRYPQLKGNWDPTRVAPTYQSVLQVPNTTTVSKCVRNGRVTFSDGPCEPGASASRVAVNGEQNIVDGMRMPAPSHAPTAPMRQVAAIESSPQLETPAAPDPAFLQAQCASHEQAIQAIDARARQPLSAGEQDWLSARRKEHRDAQFRLRC